MTGVNNGATIFSNTVRNEVPLARNKIYGGGGTWQDRGSYILPYMHTCIVLVL